MTIQAIDAKHLDDALALLEDEAALSSVRQLQRWRSFLWLYPAYLQCLGHTAGAAHCYVYLVEDAVQGVALWRQDRYAPTRCYLDALRIHSEHPQRAAIGEALLMHGVVEALPREVTSILSYVDVEQESLLALLTSYGFHQAMRRETHPLQPFSTDPLAADMAHPFINNGWKRLQPSYYESVCVHYNQQVPELWRPMLQRHPQHFAVHQQQRHLQTLERWWLPDEQNEERCLLYVELIEPGWLHPACQANLFYAPDWEFPVDELVTLLQHYVQQRWPEARLAVNTWSYQHHLRKGLAPYVDPDAQAREISLLVRDSRQASTQAGLRQRLKDLISLVDEAPEAGGSPA